MINISVEDISVFGTWKVGVLYEDVLNGCSKIKSEVGKCAKYIKSFDLIFEEINDDIYLTITVHFSGKTRRKHHYKEVLYVEPLDSDSMVRDIAPELKKRISRNNTK